MSYALSLLICLFILLPPQIFHSSPLFKNQTSPQKCCIQHTVVVSLSSLESQYVIEVVFETYFQMDSVMVFCSNNSLPDTLYLLNVLEYLFLWKILYW